MAILSTGIEWTHRDLLTNISFNPGEAGDAAYNGVDDDGNGLIDDYRGWNFAEGNWNTLDRNGRGTMMAGVIGAVTNNGYGMAGLAWKASMLPVKILDDLGEGTARAAIDGLSYAQANGARVAILDLQLKAPSPELERAIVGAVSKGLLVVVPAGDEARNLDTDPLYPAAYRIPGVIVVGGSDDGNALTELSNFGPLSVSLAAPGARIYTTGIGGRFGFVMATTVAAAQVGGVAALLMEKYPAWTPAEVAGRILSSSVPHRALYRSVESSGILSAINAVNGVLPARLDPPVALWRDVPYSYESVHPYPDNQSTSHVIHVPGALLMRVVFKRIETEKNFDVISLVAKGEVRPFEVITGTHLEHFSDYVRGDEIKVEFKADSSRNGYGFAIERVQIIR